MDEKEVGGQERDRWIRERARWRDEERERERERDKERKKTDE